MSTPSKRRRLSPDTYIAVQNTIEQDRSHANPPTPKRSSYLSPTKASLARSNPQLLQDTTQAKQDRESEPRRRQSLRDAVLGNKSLLSTEQRQPSIDSEGVLGLPTSTNTNTVLLPSTSHSSGSNRVDDFVSGGRPTTPRHERHDRQGSLGEIENGSNPRRNRSNHMFVSPSIVPQLVNSPRRTEGRTENFEVELPPTPVQLGNGKPPDRPRGLSSSSPSSGGRRRLRIRGGNIYSSPLKPKDTAPILSEDEEQDENNIEIASGLDDDRQENIQPINIEVSGAISHVERNAMVSDILPVQGTESIDGNSNVAEKEEELKTLQSQLNALEDDLKMLKTLRTNLGRDRANDLESLEGGLEVMLKDTDLDLAVSSLPTDADGLFQKQPLPYLTLFAAQNLTMSYSTWARSTSEGHKLVYQTTFAASPPWPPNAFTFSLDTTIGWETGEVEHVTLSNDKSQQRTLSTWIRSRLADPVLRYNVATLTDGMDNFFRATVRRARTWKFLIEPQASIQDDAQKQKEGSSDETITEQEAISLLPFLDLTQHAFTSNNTQQRTRRSLGSAKQLMLTYDISLDWVGRPEVKTDILMTGFNSETVDAAKTLFRDIETTNGVTEAFQEVRNLLRLKGESEPANGPDKTLYNGDKMRAKKSKARRVTAF